MNISTKARADDFRGRFREIVSDPLNLLIRRVPHAGFNDENLVYLHNGIKVPLSGSNSYYGNFSSILVINRGVHEPLEEFVFQEVVDVLPKAPVMLELGAYWGHYSMWLKSMRPDALVHLVEPDPANLRVGMSNFELNEFTGEFIQAFVGKGYFEVDRYLLEQKISRIDILHADIQGYEVEMLESCVDLLAGRRVDFLLISTHSQQLHGDSIKLLEGFNYRVEVAADFDYETTSYDGFLFASSPLVEPLFDKFTPMTRVQINDADPPLLIDYLAKVAARYSKPSHQNLAANDRALTAGG